MEILLIQIENTSEAYLKEGVFIYEKRLKSYTTFQTKTIEIAKNIRLKTTTEQKKAEALELLKHIKPSDSLVFLDEVGDKFTSVAFAQFINKQQVSNAKRLIFIIGGPFGIDYSTFTTIKYLKISLSDLTFSHQMIRLFFVEQLYRAFTILRNEKYHHV